MALPDEKKTPEDVAADLAAQEAENERVAKAAERARVKALRDAEKAAEAEAVERDKQAKAKEKADARRPTGGALREMQITSALSAAGFNGSQIGALRSVFKQK